MNKTQLTDIATRAGWTGAQATLGVAITELGSIPLWWAAPIALVLSTAKTWVAHRLPAKAAE